MFKKFLLFFVFVIFTSITQAEKIDKIVFDESHNQAFVISKEGALHLSNFAKILKEEGFEIVINKEPITKNILNDKKALIISGAFKEISKEEIEEIYNFVQNGGNLIVMLHISQPLIPLFNKFSVEITKGSVSEIENLISPEKKIDFNIKNLSNVKLFQNLKNFSVYGSWGLLSNEKDVEIIAKTSEKSFVDLNRNGIFDENEPKGPFGIVVWGKVGKGNFLFFADDAIFQNNFLKNENLILAKNLAKILKEGF